MKIDRLIGILSILLQQEKVTAPYLAEKFEVSKRTINRDIDALALAGIPIVTTQGVGGGISIMQGYRVDKTLLTSKEMQAVLAGLKSLDSVAGTNRYKQLMEKFEAGSSDILPTNNHILIDLCSWHKQTLSPKIEIIQQAIDARKKISFLYFSPSGETERTIEPQLLLFQWASWYVFGYCCLRKDFRMFKLNRLGELKVTEEKFEMRTAPPEKLENPMDYGDYRKTAFYHKEIRVAFDADMKWRIIEENGVDSFEELEDGRLSMNLHWSDKESFFSWLMSYRDKVELIGPQDLKIEYLELLKNLIQKYDKV